MKNLILVLSLWHLPNAIYAQQLFQLNCQHSAEYYQGLGVTVEMEGRAAYGSFNGIGPYRIGNKNKPNGFIFKFSEPLKTIRLQFTAIDKGERIGIEINGKKCIVTPSMALPVGEKVVDEMVVMDNGELTNNKDIMASGVILLTSVEDIRILAVRHLNGVKDGCTFGVFIEDEVKLKNKISDNVSDYKSTNIKRSEQQSAIDVYPNPSQGDFEISGNVPSKDAMDMVVTNSLGETIFKRKIQPAFNKIKERIELGNSLADGVYMIRLQNAIIDQSFKLVLHR